MTSRGVRLALLASRGQLTEVPNEYIPLLFYFKNRGIDIELEKEMLQNLSLQCCISQDSKGVETTRQSLIKLLYPEYKDERMALFEAATKTLANQDQVMRVRVNKQAKIDVNQANMLLGNK